MLRQKVGVVLILICLFTTSGYSAERVSTLFDFWRGSRDIAVLDDRALVLIESNGPVLMDITDPTDPFPVRTFEEYRGATAIARMDSTFFLAMPGWLGAFTVTDEDSLVLLNEYECGGEGLIDQLLVQYPLLIVRNTERLDTYWGGVEHVYTIFERSDAELTTLGAVEWGYGDAAEPVFTAAVYPPYVYLNINTFYMVRCPLSSSFDWEEIDIPAGQFTAIIDGYLYAGSEANIQIWSLADPESPELVNTVEGSVFGTYRRDGDQIVCGWVTDDEWWWEQDQSLSVLDISDAIHPSVVSTSDQTHGPATISGSHVYTPNVDIYHDLTSDLWELSGSYRNDGLVNRIRVINETTAVVKTGDHQWPIIDISDPTSPFLTGEQFPELESEEWEVIGGYLFVKTNPLGLNFYSIDNPTDPVFIGRYETTSGINISLPTPMGGPYWAIMVGNDLRILDLSDPTSPIVAAIHEDFPLKDLDGRRALRYGTAGLRYWSFNNIESPQYITGWYDPDLGAITSGALFNSHAIAATEFEWYDPSTGVYRTTTHLVSVDMTGFPEIQWSERIGTDVYVQFLKRYGRYELVQIGEQLQIFDILQSGPRGEAFEPTYIVRDVAMSWPYLLVAESSRLVIYDMSAEMWDGIEEEQSELLPNKISLHPAYPNPFNAGTMISFSLPHAMRAIVTVYDVLGRQVRVLQDGIQQAGEQKVFWDGRDAHGLTSSSGLYFVRLDTPDQQRIQRITLVK